MILCHRDQGTQTRAARVRSQKFEENVTKRGNVTSVVCGFIPHMSLHSSAETNQVDLRFVEGYWNYCWWCGVGLLGVCCCWFWFVLILWPLIASLHPSLNTKKFTDLALSLQPFFKLCVATDNKGKAIQKKSWLPAVFGSLNDQYKPNFRRHQMCSRQCAKHIIYERSIRRLKIRYFRWNLSWSDRDGYWSCLVERWNKGCMEESMIMQERRSEVKQREWEKEWEFLMTRDLER